MHYLVIGRQHGDDEATSEAFEAASTSEAIRRFKAMFLSEEELQELAAIEAAGSDPESEGCYDLLVYIDSVWQAETAIVPSAEGA